MSDIYFLCKLSLLSSGYNYCTVNFDRKYQRAERIYALASRSRLLEAVSML